MITYIHLDAIKTYTQNRHIKDRNILSSIRFQSNPVNFEFRLQADPVELTAGLN